MNIEEIMKPYFDKKLEFDKKYKAEEDVINKCLEEKRFLELRLERLRDNKEREISEYLQNEVLNRPGFVGYEAVRKDLENSYLQRENELKERINELDNEINFQRTKVPSEIDKYYRLDIRELVELKEQARKPLMAAKKELELKIREAQINYETLGLKITRFESKYDENYNCINGDEFRKLWNERDLITEQKYALEQQLKTVNEYIALTELTREEINTVMMSMTPWEKEEYDRRQSLINKVEEVIKPDEPVVEEPTPEVVEPENQIIENQTVVDSVSELIGTIFSDVISSAKKRSIQLSDNEDMRYLSVRSNTDEDYKLVGSVDSEKSIEIASGIYLNKNDINKALNNYSKQNKGRTFKVNGIDKTFEVTKQCIKKVKESLRECGIIKLLREKKLSSFDLKRVYGKAKGEEYSKMVELGEVKTKLPAGDYVNLNDFAVNLKNLFAEKSPSWIERVKDKMKKRLRGELKEAEPFLIEETTVKKVR